MSDFGSHLQTLQNLLQLYNIKSVFEFGCGLYSTKLFIDKCDTVYSCEMQNKEWYVKIKDKFANNTNLNIHYFDETDDPSFDAKFLAIEYFKSLNQKFDLVFVDGHKDSRWLCINVAQYYTNIIVTHDTEDNKNYHWNRIKLDQSWRRTDIQHPHPCTTYWIKQ